LHPTFDGGINSVSGNYVGQVLRACGIAAQKIVADYWMQLGNMVFV